MRSVIIIPARYNSQRLPGKVLKKDTGKYLIQHVYERACQAKLPDDVYIATDSKEVAKACMEFSAPYIMTGIEHKTGTDRIAEAVRNITPKADIVVNVQGDLPEVVPEHIDALIEGLSTTPECVMAVARTKFESKEPITNPNVVKTIVNNGNRAVYFTRGIIPFVQGEEDGVGDKSCYCKHLGIYAYKRVFLLTYVLLPQTPLEKLEKLEQLRVIEYGYPILSILVEGYYEGVDSLEQYNNFVSKYNADSNR